MQIKILHRGQRKISIQIKILRVNWKGIYMEKNKINSNSSSKIWLQRKKTLINRGNKKKYLIIIMKIVIKNKSNSQNCNLNNNHSQN